MKLRILLIFSMLLLLTGAKTGTNLDPTLVVINDNGTITASTEAISNYCIDQEHNKGGCNLRIYLIGGGVIAWSVVENQATVPAPSSSNCPCTVQFWEHGGQWHPFSAMSSPFIP